LPHEKAAERALLSRAICLFIQNSIILTPIFDSPLRGHPEGSGLLLIKRINSHGIIQDRQSKKRRSAPIKTTTIIQNKSRREQAGKTYPNQH